MPRWIHDEIGELLKRLVVVPGVAPGATATIGHYGEGRWQFVAGCAGEGGVSADEPVTPETIYDLASLTKPCVAATAARLVGQGRLQWQTPLGRLLPELSDTEASLATIEQLLSHRAGLKAHIVLDPQRLQALGENPFASRTRAEMVRCAAVAIREECRGRGGQECAPLYSDLGYILTGEAISRCMGQSLQTVVAHEVIEPLGLQIGSVDQWQKGPFASSFCNSVAPTEILVHRGGLIRGRVHDDNAWWLSGTEMSGHAGLFGNAPSVAQFAAAMVDAVLGRDSSWLSAPLAEVLVRRRVGGSLRAGFDGKSANGSSAGPQFGSSAFGHLGFTGTSVWCEPKQGVVVVLLTNRVHPSRKNIEIRRVRPALHGALFDLAKHITS